MIELLKRIKKKYPNSKKIIEYIIGSNHKYRGYENLRNYLLKNNGCNEAIEITSLLLENNIQHDIENAGPYMFHIETYMACNDLTSAIKICEEAINNKVPMVTIYRRYAQISQEHYPQETVIEIYKKFFLKHKYSYRIHKDFIEYLFSIEEYEYVEKECLTVPNLYGKESQSVQYVLANSYEKQGKFEKAQKVLSVLTSKNLNNGKAWRKLREIEDKLSKFENEPSIIRMIEFPPEYHSAGLSILQNFGKLLREKYIDIPVKVTISQEGLSVKMIIVPPNGKQFEVEEFLHEYGLVVKGELPPEAIVDNPLQVMELKNELMMARTRIEMQREQMLFLDNQNTFKIQTLEEQVDWLRTQVGNGLATQNDNFKTLALIFNNSTKNSLKLTNNLIKALKGKNKEKVKKAIAELETNDPEEYSRLKDFINNVGANAPAWIEFFSNVLPK